MSLLRAHGYSEAEVRSHSPGWAQEQWELLTRKRKLELSDEVQIVAVAGAAAQGHEGAGDRLNELVEQLRAEVDESTAWILNPDAKTDLEALRSSGRLSN